MCAGAGGRWLWEQVLWPWRKSGPTGRGREVTGEPRGSFRVQGCLLLRLSLCVFVPPLPPFSVSPCVSLSGLIVPCVPSVSPSAPRSLIVRCVPNPVIRARGQSETRVPGKTPGGRAGSEVRDTGQLSTGTGGDCMFCFGKTAWSGLKVADHETG